VAWDGVAQLYATAGALHAHVTGVTSSTNPLRRVSTERAQKAIAKGWRFNDPAVTHVPGDDVAHSLESAFIVPFATPGYLAGDHIYGDHP
jgi:hypothetical protein